MPVMIVWIVMHYTTKRREAKTLLNEESDALEILLNAADRMEKRIDSLEKILDAEDANWKDKAQ
ncbi:MAG: envelope stress response membrane protein PspB [Alphaproteobacteria bacterium]|nr:envelope stress response membrane protein PspB [Alphaproteobacteria bacterium]